MAEEAPAVEQDTPDASVEEAQTDDAAPADAEAPDAEDTPQENWEKRYQDLQPEYTRATQEAAQLRAVYEAARNPNHPQHKDALDALGLEVEAGDEDETEYLDETEELRRELEALKGRFSEQDEQAQQAAFHQAEAEFLDNRISELEKKEGREFTDHETALLVAAAVADRADDGEPQVEAAFEALKHVLDEGRERYLESKKAPRAPGQGASASQKLDFSNEEAVLERAAAAAQAAMERRE